MNITFEAKNAAQMQKALLGISRRVEDISRDFLLSTANEIVDEIKSEIQNNMHVTTGELLASIQIFDYGDDYVVLGSDSDHAWYFEFGRGAVRPVNKKFLHWIDKDTGEDVFATYSKPFEGTKLMTNTVNKHAKYFKLLVAMRNGINDEIESSGVSFE